MVIRELSLKGLYEITLTPIIDSRGFFMRVYDKNIFKNFHPEYNWLQENHSRSEKKGIIRGLHFQAEPFSETKLIRCIRGSIFDVVVDIRRNSETFCHWFGTELSEDNKKMLLIPKGFAHGFCTLSAVSEVLYKVDNVYCPKHEQGLIWNDPDIAIDWPVKDPILSIKDKKNMTLKEFLLSE
jgi:dTDP-4-dehydrorhamnose 3,5-epimerase